MAVALRTAGTLAEAAGILAADRSAHLFSGGTLVMRDINEGRITEGTLVRVADPAYRQIAVSGQRVELGAGVTMAAILARADLAFLHGAARAIGGPAIRTMATVGGNLFAAAPYGDLAVALLALDAEVMALSGYGSPRAVPLAEFLAGRARGGQGLATSVRLTAPRAAGEFRFRKVSRVKPKGLSVLSIAAHLPGAGGRLQNVRIAVGAMGPTPLRARGAERALEGRTLDAAAIAAARAGALEGLQPATDAIASEWYRREVLPVHLARLLTGEG